MTSLYVGIDPGLFNNDENTIKNIVSEVTNTVYKITMTEDTSVVITFTNIITDTEHYEIVEKLSRYSQSNNLIVENFNTTQTICIEETECNTRSYMTMGSAIVPASKQNNITITGVSASGFCDGKMLTYLVRFVNVTSGQIIAENTFSNKSESILDFAVNKFTIEKNSIIEVQMRNGTFSSGSSGKSYLYNATLNIDNS